MSDSESSTDYSSARLSTRDSSSDNDGINGDEDVFEGNFFPYQGEPLASSSSEDEEDEGEDLDGISRAVLQQRYEKILPIESWCTCGNCDHSLLVGSREFRCCKEILEASGKFTFEDLEVACILSHSDFNPLTNRTVLLQVGPLLKTKSGRCYRQYGHTENEFLRAVAYRWLARWIFGEMGWENTHPLAAYVCTIMSEAGLPQTIPKDMCQGKSEQLSDFCIFLFIIM